MVLTGYDQNAVQATHDDHWAGDHERPELTPNREDNIMVSPQEIERLENGILRPVDGRTLSDSDLREMVDFDAVLDTLRDSGETVLMAEDYVGSGAELIKDKGRLVGIPFIILQWAFHESSDFEDNIFVSCEILTKHRERFVINDGTKGGIRDQLLNVSNTTGAFNYFVCPHGLTVSEYEVEDSETGKTKKAKSYYLSS